MFQHLKFALRREATRDFEPVCRKVPDNYQPGSESQVWLTKTRPDKWRCRLKLQAMTGTCAVHEGGRDWSKKYLNALAKTHNIRGKNYWPQLEKKKKKEDMSLQNSIMIDSVNKSKRCGTYCFIMNFCEGCEKKEGRKRWGKRLVLVLNHQKV